ncbi:MAG: hypothetical protein NVV57_01410 [Demequina sp.]|nr:hypothetical protein [Demequina sp.]
MTGAAMAADVCESLLLPIGDDGALVPTGLVESLTGNDPGPSPYFAPSAALADAQTQVTDALLREQGAEKEAIRRLSSNVGTLADEYERLQAAVSGSDQQLATLAELPDVLPGAISAILDSCKELGVAVPDSPSYEPTDYLSPLVVEARDRPRWQWVCGEDEDFAAFDSLKDAWKSWDGSGECRADYVGFESFAPDKVERRALSRLAAPRDALEDTSRLWALCAALGTEVDAEGAWWYDSDLAGLEVLCPSAPGVKYLKALHDGTLFGDGDYVVGEDVPPGTYTTRKRVKDCYWERTDLHGNILDNDFVTFAAKGLTVTLRKGESFSTSGCGEWRKK